MTFDTKSIMTTKVVTVGRDTLLSEAVDILVENNITGLPVVEDDMTLVGIISEKDLLSLVENVHDETTKVEDVMSAEVVSFDQDEDMIPICECLVNSNFRRVPITSEGKLVGIISRKDIIKYILEPIA